ncbi:MAG: NAD-dependent epimerase/dehydratase family protein [Pseudomonadota bacterium]
MPSNSSPLGALPASFRRQRVLIIGCGDVGLRAARALPARVKVMALTSSPSRVASFRSHGITPLQGNLDDAATLRRLSGLASRVIHLAPPANEVPDSRRDARTLRLLRALRLRGLPQSLVYGSTSGVYGHCNGDFVPETRPVQPANARAFRRVDAEHAVRFFGRSSAVPVHILRIPGIYAPDREGGTPRTRLLKGTPVLIAEDDVYTSHIHADDLARACLAAMWRGQPQRISNVNDDTQLKMGDYFDLAADIYGLARPPRLERSAAEQQLPPMMLSFMGESRRLDNRRLKRELRLKLRYSTVSMGLAVK